MKGIRSYATRPKSAMTGAAIVVAVMLGMGATAWACTAVMGSIKVCSPSTSTCTVANANAGTTTKGSGAPGSTIKITGAGLKTSPAKYSLYFAGGIANTGLDCHTATKVLSNPSGLLLTKMTTNSAGQLDKNLTTSAIEAYKAVIPAGAPAGDAVICAREKFPTPDNSATEHAYFTIIGGTS